MSAKDLDIAPLSNSLVGVVKKVFLDNTQLNIEAAPEFKKVKIIDFEGKMKVIGMDKFNGPTYIATLSYYGSEADKVKHKAVGALILYLEASHSEKILKALGYKDAVEEDEEKTLEGCAKLCAMIGEEFKSELSSQGQGSLVMSLPESYRNEVPVGVDFCYKEIEQSEVRFTLAGKEFLAFDVTMSFAGKH